MLGQPPRTGGGKALGTGEVLRAAPIGDLLFFCAQTAEAAGRFWASGVGCDERPEPGRPGGAGSVRAHLTLRRPGTPTRESGPVGRPGPRRPRPPVPLRCEPNGCRPSSCCAHQAWGGRVPGPGRSPARRGCAASSAAAARASSCELPEAARKRPPRPGRKETRPTSACPRRGCSRAPRASRRSRAE